MLAGFGILAFAAPVPTFLIGTVFGAGGEAPAWLLNALRL